MPQGGQDARSHQRGFAAAGSADDGRKRSSCSRLMTWAVSSSRPKKWLASASLNCCRPR
ncbi:MAG: hypothetical protein M5U34_40445 [Chloroflexi bacterium]|nr:hypothetical protein [Chloroflexota bacterium]